MVTPVKEIPPLINSIFWNYPDVNDIFAFKLGCVDSIVYSDIEGGYAGAGNIALYPSFKDTTRGDWALYSNSPCINSANPDTAGLHLPSEDIAGNTRIHEGRVDIGAYEFKYSGPELVNPISDLVINEDTTEILYSNLNTVFKDYKVGESLSFSILSNTNPTLVVTTIKTDSVLSLVFASNASGVAGVVIKAVNSVDSIVYDTFNITVNPVNDHPSFTNAGNITVIEDAGLQTITTWASNIQTGPANESAQTVTFAITNLNPQIFSTQPVIDISGTITYQAAPDSFGVAILSIVCRDNGGTAWGGIDSTAVIPCTLTVQPVNDAPFFIINPMMVISATEDSGPYNSGQDWAVGIAGPVNERAQQVMHFVIKPLDMTLFAVQPAVDPVTGTLTFTPAPNVNGNTTASIQLRDNGGTANDGIDSSAVQNFTISITTVNDSPTLTTAVAQTIAEDNSLTILLSMTNASDIDNTLADTSVIVGAGANYTVVGNTITPAQNWSGVLTVPLQITDGKDTTSVVNLSVTVTAVNDAPTLTGATPQTMLANDTLALLISMVNAGDIDNTLTDASITPEPGVNYVVSGNKIIPTANFIGTLTVGIKVTDGTLSSPAVNMIVTVEQAVAVIKKDTLSDIKEILFAPNPVPVYANEVLLTIPSAMFTTGEVKIFDAMGNLIDESEINSSGGICYRWNLRNKNGELVGTGTYLAILRWKSSDETTKIVRRFIGVSR